MFRNGALGKVGLFWLNLAFLLGWIGTLGLILGRFGIIGKVLGLILGRFGIIGKVGKRGMGSSTMELIGWVDLGLKLLLWVLRVSFLVQNGQESLLFHELIVLSSCGWFL